MVWKCPKCSYRSADYNVLRRHYKNQHGSKKNTKGNQAKVYIYKPPKGRPGFGKRKR